MNRPLNHSLPNIAEMDLRLRMKKIDFITVKVFCAIASLLCETQIVQYSGWHRDI